MTVCIIIHRKNSHRKNYNRKNYKEKIIIDKILIDKMTRRQKDFYRNPSWQNDL